MIRVLFVCGQNRLRSPTAEQVFADDPRMECASAGTSSSSDVPLSTELVAWAELIFVMEAIHLRKLKAGFARQLRGKRVICLGIPDRYAFMDAELVRMLQREVPRYLRSP